MRLRAGTDNARRSLQRQHYFTIDAHAALSKTWRSFRKFRNTRRDNNTWMMSTQGHDTVVIDSRT